ncbi:putative leader peptide [Streptomyces lichenis]|uniref:putative leader peptide n=1 Tax=Streptomyces lichenis TaxID=2306967 RepID=UPI003556AF9B
MPLGGCGWCTIRCNRWSRMRIPADASAGTAAPCGPARPIRRASGHGPGSHLPSFGAGSSPRPWMPSGRRPVAFVGNTPPGTGVGADDVVSRPVRPCTEKGVEVRVVRREPRTLPCPGARAAAHSVLLTSRAHIDLRRTAGALCRR